MLVHLRQPSHRKGRWDLLVHLHSLFPNTFRAALTSSHQWFPQHSIGLHWMHSPSKLPPQMRQNGQSVAANVAVADRLQEDLPCECLSRNSRFQTSNGDLFRVVSNDALRFTCVMLSLWCKEATRYLSFRTNIIVNTLYSCYNWRQSTTLSTGKISILTWKNQKTKNRDRSINERTARAVKKYVHTGDRKLPNKRLRYNTAPSSSSGCWVNSLNKFQISLLKIALKEWLST